MKELYIVATPIGNLEDMTYRAVRVLSEVDLVLCEDTRTTRVLFDRYGITTKCMSYHSNSTKGKENFIKELFEKEGTRIALVSDAGTPTISDPGVLLVRHLQDEWGDELKVIAIPGASAVTAALSISGIAASEFLFLGFLPHKKGRETLFKEITGSKRAVVLYESPHRILKTLESLTSAVPTQRISVCREITKIYEEVVIGLPHEVKDYFDKNPDKMRGEFVVVVEGTHPLS